MFYKVLKDMFDLNKEKKISSKNDELEKKKVKENSSVEVKNVLKIRKNGKVYLVPQEIAGRYLVRDILSANSGFGLIMIAEDKRLFGRKVLIKSNNYKNKISPTNLESKNYIMQRRKSLELEKSLLLGLKKLNVPNISLICNYVKGYSPLINWPNGELDPENKYFNELAYDEPYIVLQYVNGKTLKDYMFDSNVDRMSPEWQILVLRLAKQLLKTFKIMHKGNEKGLKFVYQDLKPENIIISPNNTFTLIDFGGVAIITPDEKYINRGVGTPGYMAPEVKNKNMPFDGRVDIYSLGVIMFDLFTYESLSKYINKKGMINLDYSKLKIHPSIVKIIKKATEFRVIDRYKNCDEMLNSIFSAFREVSFDYKVNTI